VSEQMYIGQTLLVGATLFLLFRRHPRFMQIQILVWMIAVAGLAWHFNLIEQLNFYSNDQRYYHQVVENLIAERFLFSGYSLESAKLPFTGPAAVLSLLGLHPALALKTVSLIYLLLLTQLIFNEFELEKLLDQFRASYITGTAGIGMFFSVLALRETAMMFFVLKLVNATKATHHITFLLFIYLLRPHLAVALFIGQVAAVLWKLFSTRKNVGHLGLLTFIPATAVLGLLVFNFQAVGFQIGKIFSERLLDLNQSIRIASNFIGLQFLTVPEDTVNYSLARLLSLRIPLSETLAIPIIFTVVSLVFAHRIQSRHLAILGSFVIYCTISTRTDFNSFRQNIPLMPIFGLAILRLMREYRESPDETDYPRNIPSSLNVQRSGHPKRQIDSVAAY